MYSFSNTSLISTPDKLNSGRFQTVIGVLSETCGGEPGVITTRDR